MFGTSPLGAFSFGSVGGGLTTPVTPSDPDTRDWIYDPATDLPLPNSFDLLQYAGAVEDQKTTNSCLANATVSALEILLSRSRAFKDLSRLYLYWHQRKGTVNEGVDGGAYPRDGFKAANKQGVCSEDTWPFDVGAVNREPSSAADVEASGLKAYGYYSIPTGSTNTVRDIKIAVACGYPVLLALYVSDGFSNISGATLSETASKYAPTTAWGAKGGHAVLVVGYTSDGNFLIENSWGSSWGWRGYAYLPIAACMPDVFEAWTCTGLNGVAIPPLLARPIWGVNLAAPVSSLFATGTNNPQDNLAALATFDLFQLEFRGGANSKLLTEPCTLTISGVFAIQGDASLTSPKPLLATTASFSASGRGALTFGSIYGGTYGLSVRWGSRISVSLPKLRVDANAKVGTIGRALLSLPNPTISNYAGAVVAVYAPKVRVAAGGVTGRVSTIYAPKMTVVGAGKTGVIGSLALKSPAATSLGFSGGISKLTTAKTTLLASGIEGNVAKLKPSSMLLKASGSRNGSGKVSITFGKCTVVASSGGYSRLMSSRAFTAGSHKAGRIGRGLLAMPAPTIRGNLGGHFKGFMP